MIIRVALGVVLGGLALLRILRLLTNMKSEMGSALPSCTIFFPA